MAKMSAPRESGEDESLLPRVLETRRRTLRICKPVGPEDAVVQSMPDVSPTKWHLAHTTWFFERFVLRELGISPIDERYDYLFNSYYDAVGERHPRARRGLLTRPKLDEVLAYRLAVDERLADLEHSPRFRSVAAALELGIHHEEQHQELILTDIKHVLGSQPWRAAYTSAETTKEANADRREHGEERRDSRTSWCDFEGGLVDVGHAGPGFAFDNEEPRHRVYLPPFSLSSKLVTCGEYLAFVRDGGYARPELWLSEGFQWVRQHEARAPLYWSLPKTGHDGSSGDDIEIYTLRGVEALDPRAPVCHVNYYEADAYARWMRARLPTEAEWEIAARGSTSKAGALTGHFLESEHYHPREHLHLACDARDDVRRIDQLFGDVWQWTQSAYAPYPGFRPRAGAFGEYNGKFMVSQLVLRGASCVTPRTHARVTYRNFFPPNASWQFSGIRLARSE